MMTERQGDEVQAGAGQDDGPTQIRFLKEQKKGGSGFYLLAVFILVAGLGYLLVARRAVEPAGVPVPAEQAASLLVDRLWIDELPQRETDTFNFYIFSSEDNFGINDHAMSVYKHLLELFFYKLSGDTNIHFQFPHDRRQLRTTYRLEKLSKPKGDIDLKLTIAKDPQMGGKTQVYFSSTRWSSHDLRSLPTLLQGPATDALRARKPIQ